MNETLQKKYQDLKECLKNMGSAAIAFSGGTDSAFLLYAAKEALCDQVIAVTARMSSVPDEELNETEAFCEKYGIRHFFCDIDVFEIEGYCQNPKNRCYLCKKAVFTQILSLAEKNGIHTVAEGSNMDDQTAFRPGLKAIRELDVRSPLTEAGLHKKEIRDLSRELKLPTSQKPSSSCLATRFPYGEELTEEKFERAYRAEEMIKEYGFTQIRVRIHGSIARIEVPPDEFGKLLNPRTRTGLLKGMDSLGFTYVTMDLKGFRSGSMDEDPTV